MDSLFLLTVLCLASDVHSRGSVECDLGGPDYWCASCENAKKCGPEIEDLLKFCQEELGLLLECEASDIYQGVYYNAFNSQSGATTAFWQGHDGLSSPPPRDFQFDGGTVPPGYQYAGRPEDEVRYLNLGTDIRFEATFPPRPAFEDDRREKQDSRPLAIFHRTFTDDTVYEAAKDHLGGFNTDSQWDYTQQFEGATTAPIVEVVTVDFETTNALEKSGEDVTATLENPEIEPPIINRPLYNMSAYVGQATVISCEAESDVEMGVSISKLNREPKQKWLREQTKSRRRSQDDSDTKKSVTAFLTIDHLDEVDSGWYVCTAVNEGGRRRSIMYLDITDLCEGVTCDGDHEACIPDYKTRTTSCSCPTCDNELELVCGSNCKTYQNDCWLGHDNCISGSNHSMMMHAPCPRIIAPIFTVEPSDSEVEEGHHLILECHALSFPIANYLWYKVNEQDREFDSYLGEGSQYKVNEATMADEGKYYCIAAICEDGHRIRSREATVELNEHNLSTRTKTKSADRVCRVFGDPHITTFDGMSFNYAGQCSYILAMDCDLATWSVYGKFENCSSIGVQGTCLSSITVVYENSAMELQRGWAINYQGEKIDFFEAQRHEVPGFHFDLDENMNLHVNMENGASIIWDGLYSVQIILAETDNTNYCGLCGNADGDSGNDLASSSVYYTGYASEVDINGFGESWKIDPYRSCPDHKSLSVPRCSPQENQWAEQECRRMFSNPVVSACGSMLDSSYYIKACIEDSCAMRRWEGKFDPKCGVVSAYTSACRVLGLQIHDDTWREPVGCADMKDHQRFVITTGCPKSTLVGRS